MFPVIGWLVGGSHDAATAATEYQVGAADFWNSNGSGYNVNWTALGSGMGEPTSSSTAAGVNDLDFVGNTANPGLYYADQNGYIFFRMRVDAATFPLVTNPNQVGGSYVLAIDKDQNGSVDFGFSWDAKSANNATHGLEMSELNTPNPIISSTTWAAIRMDDTDNSASGKGVYDINGNSRTTDGYVRTTDSVAEVSTSVLGTTTFIDFAVSWSYLSTNCKDLNGTLYGLGSDRSWNVTAASITASTDHGAWDADIMGAATTDLVLSSPGAWSPIPEPTSALVGLLVAAGVLRRRRE